VYIGKEYILEFDFKPFDTAGCCDNMFQITKNECGMHDDAS